MSEGSIQLDRGQNLLQFHVSQVWQEIRGGGACLMVSGVQVLLSSEALMSLNTSNPAVFLTLSYSDFETQVTPVIKGARSVGPTPFKILLMVYCIPSPHFSFNSFVQLSPPCCLHIDHSSTTQHILWLQLIINSLNSYRRYSTNILCVGGKGRERGREAGMVEELECSH